MADINITTDTTITTVTSFEPGPNFRYYDDTNYYIEEGVTLTFDIGAPYEGREYYHSGNISGPGGVSIIGSEQLHFEGQYTYTGMTSLEGDHCYCVFSSLSHESHLHIGEDAFINLLGGVGDLVLYPGRLSGSGNINTANINVTLKSGDEPHTFTGRIFIVGSDPNNPGATKLIVGEEDDLGKVVTRANLRVDAATLSGYGIVEGNVSMIPNGGGLGYPGIFAPNNLTINGDLDLTGDPWFNGPTTVNLKLGISKLKVSGALTLAGNLVVDLEEGVEYPYGAYELIDHSLSSSSPLYGSFESITISGSSRNALISYVDRKVYLNFISPPIAITGYVVDSSEANDLGRWYTKLNTTTGYDSSDLREGDTVILTHTTKNGKSRNNIFIIYRIAKSDAIVLFPITDDFGNIDYNIAPSMTCGIADIRRKL